MYFAAVGKLWITHEENCSGGEQAVLHRAAVSGTVPGPALGCLAMALWAVCTWSSTAVNEQSTGTWREEKGKSLVKHVVSIIKVAMLSETWELCQSHR